MNVSASGPVRLDPWVISQQSYDEALTRLPETTRHVNRLFQMWEMQETWKTEVPMQLDPAEPGALPIKVWFPSDSRQTRWPPSTPPCELKMRSMYAYFKGGGQAAGSRQYQQGVHFGMSTPPEPHTVKAIAVTFEGVDWRTVDIAHLPAVFSAFKPLTSLRCLNFTGCHFTPGSLRNLEHALYRPATNYMPRPVIVDQLHFDNCTYGMPSMGLFIHPQPSTNWARVVCLSLSNDAPIPGLQGLQTYVLGALANLNGARLEQLSYSVPNSNDLWMQLGPTITRFQYLKEFTVRIRDEVYARSMRVPDIPAPIKKSRKSVRSLKITYKISDQRPVVRFEELSLEEQRWLGDIPAIVARCRQPSFEVV
ncbi:hypothetical protein GY45DRAFT_1325830 [Cubamyces sp. BRFM 1775]|nr:hypothetical protein GY45DRAFT_1325830 [Cubamyces sp. BRFM 1775]